MIDVSIIAAEDAGTGIQRVVRSLLDALLRSPPEGYVIRAIRATRKHPYVYADGYLTSRAASRLEGNEIPVSVESGDLYLGLDLTSRISPSRQTDFLQWHRRGVRFAFVVYDMLPRLHPHWFTERGVDSFERWLTMLAIHADALFCISRTVAAETARQPHLSRIATFWFHLGADLPRHGDTVVPRLDLPPLTETGPRILMVGTIEPRKGHRLILDAFQTLWREGSNASLTIVGKPGWRVQDIIDRLTTQAASTCRLEWYRNIDDETLASLYASCDGLIFASEGEGFGLPIVEASIYGLPLLLRDLPVFVEIAGRHASYFSAANADELIPQLRSWLDAVRTRTAPDSRKIHTLSWNDSARQLTDLIGRLDADS